VPAWTLLQMPFTDMMWATAFDPKRNKVNLDDKCRYLSVYATVLQRFHEFISHSMMELDYFEKQEKNSRVCIGVENKIDSFYIKQKYAIHSKSRAIRSHGISQVRP
jgi:hypothetical protein